MNDTSFTITAAENGVELSINTSTDDDYKTDSYVFEHTDEPAGDLEKAFQHIMEWYYPYDRFVDDNVQVKLTFDKKGSKYEEPETT